MHQRSWSTAAAAVGMILAGALACPALAAGASPVPTSVPTAAPTSVPVPASAASGATDDWSLPRDPDVVARIAFGSDLHVGRTNTPYPSGVDKLDRALKAFDQVGVDGISFVGDLTDYGQPDQYHALMSTIDRDVDTDKVPVILSMGNHETYAKGHDIAAARTVFQEQTGQTVDKLEQIDGINVITLGPGGSSDSDYRGEYDFLDRSLKTISSAPDYDPNMPIFLATHHGIKGTAYVTDEWNGNFGQGTDKDLVALLQRYPQVVQVSGHSHATVEDARSIDQSLGFTTLQDGTIGAYFENESGKVDPTSGDPATVPPEAGLASQALIVDVHRDGGTTVRRMNLATGRWIYGDEPWTFTAADARNHKYVRSRPSSPASFPAGATVGFDASATEPTSATVTFPSAVPASGANDDMIHAYRVTLTPSDGGAPVVRTVFNDYYYAPAPHDNLPVQRTSWSVKVKGLRGGVTYSARVEALTSFEDGDGTSGTAIDSGADTVTTPQAPAPSPLFDVDFGRGNADDRYGHVATASGDASRIERDDTLGRDVLRVRNDGGYGYPLTEKDYDRIGDGFTMDTVFRTADVTTDQCIFSNQQSAGMGFEVENGKLEFWMNAGSGLSKPSVAIEPNTWYHAAAVYDGSTITLYLNGKEVASAKATGGLKVPAAAARHLYIGADTSSTGTSEIRLRDGAVALARMTAQVLDADDVARLYANAGGVDSASATMTETKKALSDALDAARPIIDKGQGDYTQQTWDAFSDDYDKADAALVSFLSSGDELRAATAALTAAQGALATKPGEGGDQPGQGGQGGDQPGEPGQGGQEQPGGSDNPNQPGQGTGRPGQGGSDQDQPGQNGQGGSDQSGQSSRPGASDKPGAVSGANGGRNGQSGTVARTGASVGVAALSAGCLIAAAAIALTVRRLRHQS